MMVSHFSRHGNRRYCLYYLACLRHELWGSTDNFCFHYRQLGRIVYSMTSPSSFLTWLRHPGSIALLIAVVLMLVMLLEKRSHQPAVENTVAKSSVKPARVGNELPRIVRQFSAPTAPVSGGDPKSGVVSGSLKAPELSSLLGTLEDKVKAEPGNISNRLLLAQTYNELGFSEKALQEARAASALDLDHSRAKLVLASILSSRDSVDGLNEAKGLLEELKSSGESKQYLVAMYLGDTFIRLGNHDAALSYWQQSVKTMPASDNRRPLIEKRIQSLSAKTVQ